jgi:hypothetical protein
MAMAPPALREWLDMPGDVPWHGIWSYYTEFKALSKQMVSNIESKASLVKLGNT